MQTEQNSVEVIDVPRDIRYLLTLDTYQEMTDAEIESVINYKIAQALANAEVTTMMAMHNARVEDKIAENRKAIDASMSILNKMYNSLNSAEKVKQTELQTFTPQLPSIERVEVSGNE